MSKHIINVSSCIVSLFAVAGVISTATAQPYAYVANSGSATYAALNLGASFASQSPFLGGAVGGVAVSPDGSTVYSTLTYLNSVTAVSTSNNSLIATIPVGTTPGHLAVSPNGAWVYAVDQASNQVSVISTASKSVVSTISVGARPNSVAFSPDSSRAYVTNMWGGTVSAINTSTFQVVGTFTTGTTPSGIAVTPDGQHIYVTCQSPNTVTVLDASGNTVATIGGFTYPVGVAITPDGSRAYVVNESAMSVSVVSTSGNNIVGTIGVGSFPTSVAITADGTQALVTNEYSYNVSIISTASNSVLKTMSCGGFYPVAIATVPAASSVTTPPSPQPPPPPCTFTLNPLGSLSFGPTGGAVQITVNASASTCAWTASGPSWATISPTSGTGTMNITVTVGANLGITSLAGQITVNGVSVGTGQSGTVFTGVRVNAGGGAFTDSRGNVWQADPNRNTASTTTPISGADIPAVYQKEAFSSTGLTYSLAVPAGTVTVKLRFAEIYLMQPGQRVMNISINGVAVGTGQSFDILSHIGPNTAYDLVVPGVTSNGTVTVQITPATTGSVAKLSGLEIY